MTRGDIMHQCDLSEEVAIAYGYNNIQTRLPSNATNGGQILLNKACDLLRIEMASCGYTECLNFILCSKDETSIKL